MSIRAPYLVLVALGIATLGGSALADDYAVDTAHSAAMFRISHLGLSWVYGRFKDLSGTFTVDPRNLAATRFALAARIDSVDTGNSQRDQHLKSPDFFNAKQFPALAFKSTAAKSIEGGYEVAGTLTLHGVTKPLTIVLKGGKTAAFPPGVQRTGYSGDFTLKRSDFGMNKMVGPVGDEVHVMLSFEGTKK